MVETRQAINMPRKQVMTLIAQDRLAWYLSGVKNVNELGELKAKTGVDSWVHGTFKGFTKGCRCEACVKVARQRSIEQAKRAKMMRRINDKRDKMHGTTGGYDNGCRCARCVKAHRNRKYIQEQIERTGGGEFRW